jgi:rhodanese-related sulfurtransferase
MTVTWTSLLIAIIVVAAFLLLRRGMQIPGKAAAAYLRNGAVVIDVRSAGEFTAGHLVKAINIPLSEIESVTARKFTNKNEVLLLHCQSGKRSSEAARKLKELGYTNVYNLGSFDRAAQIVSGR